MRRISIFMAKPGMLLANEVINSTGKILICKNTELTSGYIDKLIELGIPYVYIDDELSRGIEVEEPISPVLRAEGLMAVRNKDIDSCRRISRVIVEELLNHGVFSLDMADLRTYDDYTYAHSVNVAVLACTIGLGLQLREQELEDIVFASLLHDMGKMEIPEEILNKEGRLTQQEFALMKTHPKVSYDLIADNYEISSIVKNAVLCHHENYDGSGYPNGLSGEKISKIASIIHVADVYDALVSKRPYKEPYPVYVALEILRGGSGTQFQPEAVDALLKYVPVYPKGSLVELSDGRSGIVVENYGIHNERPILRMNDFTEIDLADEENKEVFVATLSEEDFIKIQELEMQRADMVKDLKRLNIMVLDQKGETYHNLVKKMNYLYQFKLSQSDTQMEGYLTKYGYPDLIIVDIDQRNLSNIEMNRKKNEAISSRVPVIVVGSCSDLDTIKKLRCCGVRNYILKPFHTIYVQNEIHRLLYKTEQ